MPVDVTVSTPAFDVFASSSASGETSQARHPQSSSSSSGFRDTLNAEIGDSAHHSEAGSDKPAAHSGNKKGKSQDSDSQAPKPAAPLTSASQVARSGQGNSESPNVKHAGSAGASNDSSSPASELAAQASVPQLLGPAGANTELPQPAAGQNRRESSPGKVNGADAVTALSQLKKSAPVGGDLALAMRISSRSGSSSADKDASGDDLSRDAGSQSLGLPVKGQPSAASLAEAGSRHEAEPAPVLGLVHPASSPSAADAARPSQTDASSASHPADFEAELLKYRSEPVRGAHVQISGADNQRVDIRLVERSGALSVTVRSADIGLAKMLQDRAPELNNNLSLQHFKTELWTPPANKSSEPRSSDGNSASQHEHSQQSGDRNNDRRQNGKQQDEPEWIAELEKNSSAFQKRIDYTWQR